METHYEKYKFSHLQCSKVGYTLRHAFQYRQIYQTCKICTLSSLERCKSWDQFDFLDHGQQKRSLQCRTLGIHHLKRRPSKTFDLQKIAEIFALKKGQF